MKLDKKEQAALIAANEDAKSALTEKKRKAAELRKREKIESKDVWHQATKVIVPAWFGQCNVRKGVKLGETFTAAGVLALVSVGQSAREKNELSTGAQSEVGMQMKLRPSGFDRQEARELAERGFSELRQHKLVRAFKKSSASAELGDYQPQLEQYVLSAKGTKWFELIERSAGCAPEPKMV